MLETLSYNEILRFFVALYTKDLGEEKFVKITEKILTSNKVSGLISTSKYHQTPITARDILYTINGILFFTFSSNRTQAMAALMTLERWNQEVNSQLHLANHNTLKSIAIEIIKELKAHYTTQEINDNKFNHNIISEIGKGLFLLPQRISYSDFIIKLGNIKYKLTEYKTTKFVTIHHSFDWNKITNSTIANWNLANSAQLVIYFSNIDNLITTQVFEFDSIQSAQLLFEIISKQAGWKIEIVSPNKHNAISSTENGKYRLELKKERGQFDMENSLVILHYLK